MPMQECLTPLKEPKKKELTEEQKRRLEEEKARLVLEAKRRRMVFEAICALSDPVSEDVMRKHLDVLDVNSWAEVVEERYLGKLCGFPTCSNSLASKSAQKYRIDRKNKKIFEVCAEYQKFCSTRCFDCSAVVSSQLSELPIWLTGERDPKTYVTEPTNEHPSASQSGAQGDATAKPDEVKVEIVPDRLIAQITDLKIAEHAESDEEEPEEGTSVADVRDDRDEQFVQNIRSFITMRTASSTAPAAQSKRSREDSTSSQFSTQTPASTLPAPTEAEEKLLKLREKYGKNQRLAKAPPIVDPAPILDERARRMANT
ncbi:Protein R08D7.2 [Aphelenchoides avenae]|nr:Protein R08D7.2 [Aphelenchus avenae]